MIKSLVFAFLAYATTSNATPSTDQVWQHHIAAWSARDLDGIVSDYTDESVLILNNEIFRGPKAIKQVFTRLFGIFDNGENKIDTPIVDGRIVYITWHFSPSIETSEYFGTDTFVIEDGKILVQTIASPLYYTY